jgi:hypothetical protein
VGARSPTRPVERPGTKPALGDGLNASEDESLPGREILRGVRAHANMVLQ